MRTSSKITAVIGGAALTVATAGVAFAYWTTTGSGSGSASAAATAGTLSLSGGPVSGLVPGGSVNVPITASNGSSTTSLQASTLTASNLTVDAPHAACLALVNAPTMADTDPGATTVAPSSSASFGSVTISLANAAAENQDACKSAVFSFDLAAS